MMQKLKQKWFQVPRPVRRPIVFVVGWLLIIIAGSIGWIPGPGGVPVFLLGIAVLATEFTWADKVRRFFLGIIYRVSFWYRYHRGLGTFLLIVIIIVFGAITYKLYTLL